MRFQKAFDEAKKLSNSDFNYCELFHGHLWTNTKTKDVAIIFHTREYCAMGTDLAACKKTTIPAGRCDAINRAMASQAGTKKKEAGFTGDSCSAVCTGGFAKHNVVYVKSLKKFFTW